MPKRIPLLCRTCGNAKLVDRDADVPKRAIRLEQGMCPLCWNGDRDEEWMVDRRGNILEPRAA